MGGVKPFETEFDDDTLLEPDTAQNNTFDMEAAEFFYRRCQECGVPLIVLSRMAVYRCPMPRSVYDRMARTGNPVGLRLQNSQRQSIEDLWQRSCMAPSDPARLGLPPRCNKEWFTNTFCGGGGMDRSGDESIWDLIQSFNMYDPMALLASIPQIRHRYFEWESKVVNGVEHIVIGVSKEKHGVKEELAAELISFMYNSFLKGVTLDWSEFDLVNKAVKTNEGDSGASSAVSSQDNTPRSNQLSPRRIIDVTDGASLPNTLTRVRGEKAAINFDNELFMSQFDEHLQEVLRDEEDINELRK